MSLISAESMLIEYIWLNFSQQKYVSFLIIIHGEKISIPGAQINNVVQNTVLFGRRFKYHNIGLFAQRALSTKYLETLFHRHSIIREV